MNIIAFDLGGTTIKYGRYQNSLLDFNVLPTPKNKQKFLSLLAKILETYAKNAKIDAIAIGLPGISNYHSGKIENLPNLPFLNGLDIANFLKKFSKNIKVDNDAKCVMRAEHALGSARNFKNVVLLIVGTGVGGAIVIDNKIYYGRGAAGEIGQVVFGDQAANQTLEQLIAKKKLLRSAASKKSIADLTRAAANIMNIFDPEAIIFGGGVMDNHFTELIPKVKGGLQKYLLLKRRAKSIKMLPTKFKEKAGVIGAALLFKS